MLLHNQTQGTIITKDLQIARTLIDQLLGLLRKSNSRAILFYTRFGIHTFGLTQPIDLLVLGANYQIVKIKHNLLPNHLFFWNPKYSIVIELPSASIKKSRSKTGDLLKLTPLD